MISGRNGIYPIALKELMVKMCALEHRKIVGHYFSITRIAYGKESDNGIFKKSVIGQKIVNKTYNIPPPKCLPGTDVMISHFLNGDEAFTLDTYMTKPYPRRVQD